MDILTLALLVAIIALLAYLLWQRRTPQDTQSMLLLQQRIQELERSIEAKLGEGTDRMFEGIRMQSDQSQKTIGNIQQQLVEMQAGLLKLQSKEQMVAQR